MVPLFGLGLTAALAGRGYRFMQHLVFTAHYYCIHLAALLVVWGVAIGPTYRFLKEHPALPLAPELTALLPSLWVQNWLVAPALSPYLFAGLKRAYGLSARQALWRAALLTAWSVTIARAFLDVAYGLALLFA